MQSFINPGRSPGKEKQQQQQKAFFKTGVKGQVFPTAQDTVQSDPTEALCIAAPRGFISCPEEVEATNLFLILFPVSQTSSGTRSSMAKAHTFIPLPCLWLLIDLMETAAA